MRSGFAEHVSAVGTLGDALDGTPVKRKRAAAKKPDPNSSVSTAVRCECGDQFDDFRTAWLHVYQGKCEVLTNVGDLRRSDGNRLVAQCGTPGGYQRHRRIGEPTCDSCRAVVAEEAYERRALRRADPEYRERERKYQREYQREYQARRRVDPEYREHRRELQRAYKARKKAGLTAATASQTRGA